MSALWSDLPASAQDTLILIAFLSPLFGIAAVLLRGFAPWPLVRGVLWRFCWANAVFVALIAVSVAMGVGLVAQERGLRAGTAKAADKFDMIIAVPGSEMTMMLATVFLQPSNVPLIMGDVYNEIDSHPHVAMAAPLAFGDSYDGAPVVGTTADFAMYLSDGRYAGPQWSTAQQALAGALVDLEPGDTFTPLHGFGDDAEAAHEDILTVIGKLPRTGTPWDRAILVPVESVWQTHGLSDGHAPARAGQIGPPFDARFFPGTPAVIVRTDALWQAYAVQADFTRDAEVMAFFPGALLSQLYGIMGDVRQAMTLLTLVSQALVAIAILLGLFILTRLLQRQMAMLRAIGAPGRFLVAVVWSYGTILIVVGTGIGLLLGFGAASVLSGFLSARTDIAITPSFGWFEVHLAAGFLGLAALLALLPALAAARMRIAANLR